jgi:PRC-barrel domain
MSGAETRIDLWVFRDDALADADLTGFRVEGRDGEDLGTVHEATRETGASYLVVLTGIWFFSRKVVLPAAVVDRIDLDTETVFVNVAKDEIERAPEFDADVYREASYRQTLGSYYGARSPG